MRTYFEPEINVSVFDEINCATVSGNGVLETNMSKDSSKQVGVVNYNNLNNEASTAASLAN